MKRMMFVWLLMAVCAAWSGPAQGAYHHQGEQDAPQFLMAYPDKASTKLDDCVLCHRGNTYTTKKGNVVTESACQFCHAEYGYDGSGDIEATMNPFGVAYRDAGRNVAAFAAIEADDSDNDTYSNITEINALRYPGDPEDDPSKVAAPHIFLTRVEMETMLTPHEQFMLMNTSRGGESGKDYYITYTGFIMQELLEAAGWTDNSTGVTVTAPDGFSFTYDRVSNETDTNYFIEGIYPQASFFYNAEADWVDYSAPGCIGRTNGQLISVTNGLKMILAYKANGAYMEPAYQDDDDKLNGEGPFRAVPPQWNPGYPDRQATSDTPYAEPWPYDPDEIHTDHNAGFSARGVTAIRVDPLPEGTTEYDWRNSQTDGGWGLLEEEKIVIYGNLRNGNIKGSVVAGPAGTPIANALVQTDIGGYATLTDINGHFMLSGVVSGAEGSEINYTLTASADSYLSRSEAVTVTDGDNQTVQFTLVQCMIDADCDNGIFCDGAETCEIGVCAAGPGDPCEVDEVCKEAIDQCIPEECDLEWDLDVDCDVDKDDFKLLKLQQKNEKRALKAQQKAEKQALKAAKGTSGDCEAEWDLDDDCDVDKDDAKLLKLRQKDEKTALKDQHKADKAAIKAAQQ